MVRGRGPEGPGGGSLLGRRSGIFRWCGCRGSHAGEAERAGLVNKVVPRTNLSEAVDAYVAKLLAKSSTVLALTKQALREGAGHHFEKALDRSQELYLRDLTRTEDMVEGMNAFLEKWPPAWRNR